MVLCVLPDAGMVCEGYTRGQVQGLILLTGVSCTLAGITTLVLIKLRLIRISTILLAMSLWFYVLAAALSDAPRLTKDSYAGYDRASIVFKTLSHAATLSYMLYVLSAMLSCFTVDMHAVACAVFGVAAAASVGLGIAPPWIASHAPGGREIYVSSDQMGLFDAMIRASLGASIFCHVVVMLALWRFRKYALFDETLDDQFSSILGIGTIFGLVAHIIAIASPGHFITIMIRRIFLPLQLVFYIFYIVFGGYTLRPPWALKIDEDWEDEGDYRDASSVDVDEYYREQEPPRGGAGKYNTLASATASRAPSEYGRSRRASDTPPQSYSRRPSMRQNQYSEDPYSRYEDNGRQNIRQLTPTFHAQPSYNDHKHPDYAYSHSHHQSYSRDRQPSAAYGRSASGHGRDREPYGYERERSSSRQHHPTRRDSFESVDSYHDPPTPDSHELVEISRSASKKDLAQRYRDDSYDDLRSPRRAVVYGTTDATAQMAERRSHRMDRDSGLMIASRRVPGPSSSGRRSGGV